MSRELVTALLRWYDENKRSLPWRSTRDPYRVWVAEVMLCQTRIETVLPRYEAFLTAFPTVFALAESDIEAVRKVWQGLGYYRRAELLLRGAQAVVTQYNGVLPAEHKALRALPGFGEYTAASVGSIALGLPVPAVDGNVLRVVSRLRALTDDVTQSATRRRTGAFLQTIIPADRPGDFNEALMELGETICTPSSPRCGVCPLAALCQARAQGLAAELPVRSGRRPRKSQKYTVLLLCCRGQYALEKRPEHGLLAGLYQFPMLPGDRSERELTERYAPVALRPLGKQNHLFTHLEWHMTGYRLELTELLPGLIWANEKEIAEQYAIPSAFAFILKELKI